MLHRKNNDDEAKEYKYFINYLRHRIKGDFDMKRHCQEVNKLIILVNVCDLSC